MSKNLTGSANIQATNAQINSITYKGGDVSDTIHSELVKRVSLHPTIVNGKLEKRTHYSLHNDASKCVMISPQMESELFQNEIIDTVPNGDFQGDKPPFHIYPVPFEPSDTSDEKPFPPPGVGPVIPIVNNGATDFDNYSQQLFQYDVTTQQPMRYKPNSVENMQEVTQFYENYSRMVTARYAMAYTRSPLKKKGRNIKDVYGNLENGIGMYSASNITSVELVTPVMILGDYMFKDCSILTSVKLDAAHLLSSSHMCEGCINLKDFVLSDEIFVGEAASYPLTDITYMFKDCRNLNSVTFPITSRIIHIDHAFENCSSFRFISLEKIEDHRAPLRNATTATYAFAGSRFKELTIDFDSVTDASHMFENCKKLTRIKQGSNLKSMTNGEYMCKNCTALVSDGISEYPKLVNAKGMYEGCISLQTVHPKYTVLEDGQDLFKSCKLLTKVNFKGKFPALKKGNQMFLDCKRLDKVVSTFDSLEEAQLMFKGCKGIQKIEVTAPKLVLAHSMFEETNPVGTVKFDAPLVELMPQFLQNAKGTGFKFEGNINPVHMDYSFANSSITSFKNEKEEFSRLSSAWGTFENCKKLSKVEFGSAPVLTYIDSLVKNCRNLTHFSGNFPKVTGYTTSPFTGCLRLKTVKLDVPLLTEAPAMFRDMPELESVEGTFTGVRNARNMFRNCPKLKVFPEVRYAEDGLGMYQDTLIDDIPFMPNLTNGRQTFQNCQNIKGSVNLEQFSHLENGINMFNNCDGITSVSLYLPNASDIRNMFALCENITRVYSVVLAEGVSATSVLMHSKVDFNSFRNVYNGIKDKNPKADVNGCVCHVGVTRDTLVAIREQYGELKDADDNPLFYHWEGNQYALRLNTTTNNFVMAVVNA